MKGVKPTVRHMLLCDDAEHQPGHPTRWNVTGLMHALTFAEGTDFSTHHHLNLKILAKYRTVTAWFFSVYEHIELTRIYRMTRSQLESLFAKWEAKWKSDKRDINNPKIPLAFVETSGQLVYPLPTPS